MKAGRRIIEAAVIIDLLAFGLFFIWAAWQRSADAVIPLHATRWEFATAFLLFSRWLPGLQFLALAVAIGSLAGKAEDIFRASILPAIILSAAFSATILVLAPGAEATKGALDSASRRYNAALAETALALDQGRVEDARASFGTVAAIDRKDLRAEQLLLRLQGAELKALREPKKPAPLARPAPDKAAAKEELRQAAEYLRQRDWYAAWWHAGKASNLDPGLSEAKRLQSQAWGEILDRGGGEKDAQRVAFFTRKTEAYARMRGGDAVTAYQLFRELAAESPGDEDVHRYLGESLAALGKEAFFKDEADEAAGSSDFQDLVLMLPAKDGSRKAVAAKEVAFAPAAAFFFDFEYMEIDPSGWERAHYLARYAKLVDGMLLMQAVERQNPATVYRAQAADGGSAPRSLALELDPVETYRYAVGLRRPASATILDLYTAAVEAPSRLLDDRPFLLELLRRLGLPFALFGATILGTLLGLRFRDPGRKPSRAAWLAFPFMALVSAALWQGFEILDAGVARWTLEAVPGPVSLLASAGVRALVLALLVVVAASIKESVKTDAGED